MRQYLAIEVWLPALCINVRSNATMWAATGTTDGRGSEHDPKYRENVETRNDTTSELGEDGWLAGSAITGNELTLCGINQPSAAAILTAPYISLVQPFRSPTLVKCRCRAFDNVP